MNLIENFTFDRLALIIATLIVTISIIVAKYSINYLDGDSKHKEFFVKLFFLTMAALGFTFSNNIYIFGIFWFLADLILSSMMIHKHSWVQALNAGILARKTFLISFLCLTAASLILHFATGSFLISEILKLQELNLSILFAISLIIIAAMIQSAQYPFNKWLISSANSPTPVSAFMHAGLINAGGFLLCKFSPLISLSENLLVSIFVIGFVSALLGSLWTLVRTDIKGSLACSTLGQMGFMFMQCGLGLFPLAITHLFWHGLYKANLFLGAGSALKSNLSGYLNHQFKLTNFVSSIFLAMILSTMFMKIAFGDFFYTNTLLFVHIFTVLAFSQILHSGINSLNLFDEKLMLFFKMTLVIISYSYTVLLIEKILKPSLQMMDLTLNMIHIAALIIFTVIWFLINVFKDPLIMFSGKMKNKIYMTLVNASQAIPSTITSRRGDYSYAK